MKFCRPTVEAHMKDEHSMTLDEYESSVGMGTNGEFHGDVVEGSAAMSGGALAEDDDHHDRWDHFLKFYFSHLSKHHHSFPNAKGASDKDIHD